MRRITLNGEKQKVVMATYLINQSISAYSSAKPVNEKLNVKRRGDEYKTDINNLSSGKSLSIFQNRNLFQFFYSRVDRYSCGPIIVRLDL